MKVKFLSGFEGVYFESRRSHICRCSQEKAGRRVCIFIVLSVWLCTYCSVEHGCSQKKFMTKAMSMVKFSS